MSLLKMTLFRWFQIVHKIVITFFKGKYFIIPVSVNANVFQPIYDIKIRTIGVLAMNIDS